MTWKRASKKEKNSSGKTKQKKKEENTSLSTATGTKSRTNRTRRTPGPSKVGKKAKRHPRTRGKQGQVDEINRPKGELVPNWENTSRKKKSKRG